MYPFDEPYLERKFAIPPKISITKMSRSGHAIAKRAGEQLNCGSTKLYRNEPPLPQARYGGCAGR